MIWFEILAGIAFVAFIIFLNVKFGNKTKKTNGLETFNSLTPLNGIGFFNDDNK